MDLDDVITRNNIPTLACLNYKIMILIFQFFQQV